MILSPPVLVPVVDPQATNPTSLAVADLNKDGLADLVSVVGVGATVNLATGNNAFAASTEIQGGGNGTASIADMDGDGWPDIVTFGNGGAGIALNDKTGHFGASFQAGPQGEMFSVATGVVADLNGDKIPDLAMMGNGLTIALGSGGGAFAAMGTPVSLSNAWGNVFGDTGNSATWIAAGDIDGDGSIDLVITSINNLSQGNVADGGLCVSRNTGHGSSFADPVCVPVLPNFGAFSVVLADFNGDGALDAAVGGVGDNNGSLEIFINKGGTAGFKNPVDYSGGAYNADSVVVADVNNDGKLDVIGADENGGVIVWLGNGDGTFSTTPLTYAAGNAQQSEGILGAGIFSSNGLTSIGVVNNFTTTMSAPNGGIQILAGTCTK